MDKEASVEPAEQPSITMPYPMAQWHVFQGDTNDCGPHCVAIVTNTLYATQRVHPEDIALDLNRRGFPDRIPGWATMPWGLAAVLKRQGLESRWRKALPLDALIENLSLGRLTIVIVGEPLRFVGGRYRGWSHYKVLSTWQPARGFGFVDPGTARPDGMTWRTREEFLREWNAMGRQIVEAWRPDAAAVPEMR